MPASSRTARKRISTRIQLALLCSALTLAGACEPATGAVDTLPGVYALSTIDGQPLPHEQTFEEDGFSYVVRVTSGSLDVQESGTFVNAVTLTFIFDGESETFNTRTQGTWTRAGSTLTIRATSFTVNGAPEEFESDPVTVQIGDGRLTFTSTDPETGTQTVVYVK